MKNGYITQLHRVVIFLMIVAGSVLDGIDMEDLFFIASSLLWLWMPHCIRMEQKLFAVKRNN